MFPEAISAFVFFGIIFSVVFFACYAVTDGFQMTPKEPPMACPATDYEEKCDINREEATVKRWGAREWGKYETWVTCNRCGERFHRFGLKRHELEDVGIDVDEQLEERIL